MSLTPGSYLAVRACPTGQDQVSMTIILPKSANAPTVIDFKNMVGAWLAWCPAATAADTISVLCQQSGATPPIAADLNLPAPGTAAAAIAFDAFRGDEMILIDAADERVPVQLVSNKIYEQKPQWTQFAFQWNGGADSYLVLRRVGLR